MQIDFVGGWGVVGLVLHCHARLSLFQLNHLRKKKKVKQLYEYHCNGQNHFKKKHQERTDARWRPRVLSLLLPWPLARLGHVRGIEGSVADQSGIEGSVTEQEGPLLWLVQAEYRDVTVAHEQFGVCWGGQVSGHRAS